MVPPPQPSTTGGKAVSYSVLRIVDHNGLVRYEVVESRSVKNTEAEVQQAYLKAARQWKPGDNPGAPQQQPLKPEVRVWRTVMGGPDARERAEAVAIECRKREKQGKTPGAESATEPAKGSGGTPEDAARPASKIPGPLVK